MLNRLLDNKYFVGAWVVGAASFMVYNAKSTKEHHETTTYGHDILATKQAVKVVPKPINKSVVVPVSAPVAKIDSSEFAEIVATAVASNDETPEETGSATTSSELISPAVSSYVYVEEEGDDEAWEKEKQSCSFCASFIASPCKDVFKSWSKCVDKTRDMEGVDFTVVCASYTKGLMECMNVNAEFFQKQAEQFEAEHNAQIAAEAQLEAEAEPSSLNVADTEVKEGSIEEGKVSEVVIVESDVVESSGGGDNDSTD